MVKWILGVDNQFYLVLVVDEVKRIAAALPTAARPTIAFNAAISRATNDGGTVTDKVEAQ